MSQSVFVALTGYNPTADLMNLAAGEFHTYLVKPVEPDDLRELLARLAAQRGHVPADTVLAAAINFPHGIS